MEIQLISEESFTVSANGKQVSGLRVVSEWEGLKKLVDAKGRSLIVTSPKGPFAEMLDDLIGKKLRGAMIIMGSPELLIELSPDKPPGTTD